MPADLMRWLEGLDDDRRVLCDDLRTLSPAQLAARPDDDTWSLIEVLEHLVVAEREVLQDLRPPRPARRGLRQRVFYHVTLLFLRSGLTVAVPSPTMVPKGGASFDELDGLWEQNRLWLRDYVAALDDARLRLPVFAHPVTGPLPTQETLHLLQVHFDSHLRDVRKLRAR